MLAFVLGAMVCVPGGLWLIIQSRWREVPVAELSAPANVASANEEALEGRIG